MVTAITLTLSESIINNYLQSGAEADNANYFAITGTGFGTKSHQSPTLVETFSGATDGQYLPAHNPSRYTAYNGSSGGIMSSANPRYSGHRSVSTNNAAGTTQFNNSYSSFTATDKVFISYWIRYNNVITTQDYVQFKMSRITSSSATGGGGVYNGAGSHRVNQLFTSSNGTNGAINGAEVVYEHTTSSVDVLLGHVNKANNDQWAQVQYEVKLNSVADATDGIFNTFIGTGGVVSTNTNTNVSQRRAGATYLLDTHLIGTMTANPRRFFGINTLPSMTDYTATLAGVPYTVNSGVTPIASVILAAIAALVNAAGKYAIVIDGAEIYCAVSSSSGVEIATYDSKFTQRVSSVQIADIYLETGSLSRVVACDSATYATAAIREPIPYISWTDTKVVLTRNWNSVISGTKHLHIVKDDLSTAYLGVYA